MKKLGEVKNPLHHSHPLVLVDSSSAFGGWTDHEDRIGGAEELSLDGVTAFLAGRSDHGPAAVFEHKGELVIVNPESPSKRSAEDMASASRAKLKSLGKLQVPTGQLTIAIAYYPLNRTVAGARKHTPESKLVVDVGAGVFDVLGDESKFGPRFVLRRKSGKAKAIKVTSAKSAPSRVANTKGKATKNAKLDAMMALLGGDVDKMKKLLRAHYAIPEQAGRAGLTPADVKSALGANGDPPLSRLMELMAVRGNDEIEGWNELSAAAAAKKSPKVKAMLAFLGGDRSKATKLLRAHYATQALLDQAGLSKAEVTAALSANGDPSLYFFVKLVAVRGEEETAVWEELKG